MTDAWGAAVSPPDHPLPISGVDVHNYQQFAGCGSLAAFVTEIVVKGGDLWYRRSDDIQGANIGNKIFTHTTLAAMWGTAGPPTTGVDVVNYDIFAGSPREIVVKGGDLWYRSYNCATSQWSTWTASTLTKSWSQTKTPPPTTGPDVYVSDYLSTTGATEIVVNGDKVWWRRSKTDSAGMPVDWNINMLKYFWYWGNPSPAYAEIPTALSLSFSTANLRQTAVLNGTWYIRQDGLTAAFSSIKIPGFWRRDAYGIQWYVKPAYTSVFRYLDNPYPGFTGSVVYVTKFVLPADTAGKAISLNFDRISAAAEVYVNDKFAGFHIGSTDPFEFPIHDLTVSGQTNKLAIRIIDMAEYQNKMLPASYQDRTHGGIYGDAKLTVSDKNKINLVKAYTPDNASVSLSAVVTNYSTASSSMTLKAEVVSSTGMVVGSGTSAAFTLGAGGKTTKSWNISSVPGVLKWSPENPNLYTIRTTLIRSGISVDQTVMNFGFRSFGISSDTQKFTLNGSKYFLKGASIVAHREVRNDPVFIKNFVAKVKESGANAIRFHLGPPSHYWLDETDRQGSSLRWTDFTTCPSGKRGFQI